MARNITQICNEAISDVPAHPISNIDDQTSTEAQECARHLPGIVSELIEMHDWDFVRRRIALAEVANDRPEEWAHAYVLPASMASPIALVPVDITSSLIAPVLHWSWAYDRLLLDYAIADGKLYTNLEGAVLEYSTDALEPQNWTALFAQAVIRALAARIYRPILGAESDSQEVGFKLRLAERAMKEAVADDLNRHPRRRQDFISEGEMARQSFGFGAMPWLR